MSDARESQLLLAILRESWGEAEALPRPRPAMFVELARACDVHPTVHAILERTRRFDLVGGEAEEALQRLRAKVRQDNLLLLARAEQALDVLAGAGIVPVALKGLDTLHRYYGRFDARTLDDVDLLVPEERLGDGVRALEAAGWTAPPEPERTHWLRSSFELPLTSPGPVTVGLELHWSLGQEGRYTVDARALRARAVPARICERDLLRLDDHDAAAHLLLHHVQHYFDRRLKWALDLRSMVREPGFAWRAVAERLTAWGGRGAAGLALAHLVRLFPDLGSEEALRALPAAAWRRAALLPLRTLHPIDLYRGTRRRFVQLWLAAAALERPQDLPGYLRRRARRDQDGEGRAL
ncbi:MAG TPA: nucleotidyltransferase family protein [Candidatus Polarisedimenticolaceae bacterium]|nr:nucleotidyltransferase family protein [Candidatus Polarisedimenticolaceae bacterium]